MTHSDNGRIPSLTGKSAVVTGTAGLGFEIGSALAGSGCAVVLAGRDAAKGRAAVGDIKGRFPKADMRFENIDLAELESVSAFAERLRTEGRPVDILVNSAGLIATQRMTTRAGHELQFGVNYLGHFALTGRLLPLLRLSPDTRVVTLGGAAYRTASINFDDINSEKSFNALKAGGQAMLAKVLFARELQRRSDAQKWGLKSMAADPGWARTDVLTKAQAPFAMTMVMGLLGHIVGQSPTQGAQSAVLAATAPDAVPGGFYAPSGGTKGHPALKEAAPVAKDDAVASRLWDTSQDLTGHPFPQAA